MIADALKILHWVGAFFIAFGALAGLCWLVEIIYEGIASLLSHSGKED